MFMHCFRPREADSAVLMSLFVYVSYPPRNGIVRKVSHVSASVPTSKKRFLIYIFAHVSFLHTFADISHLIELKIVRGEAEWLARNCSPAINISALRLRFYCGGF
jgi:hypothetical protein